MGHHVLREGCSLHPLARDTVMSSKAADVSPLKAVSPRPSWGDRG